MKFVQALLVVLVVFLCSASAQAQTASAVCWRFTPYGWVEIYAQSAFDTPRQPFLEWRHNTASTGVFTLGNAVLGARTSCGRLHVTAALNYGQQPQVEFANDIRVGGALYGLVHELVVGVDMGARRRVRLDMGVMTAPFGYESRAVHDERLYSRSLQFFAYPYYLTGGRLVYTPSSAVELSAWLVTGWSGTLDVNTVPTGVLAVKSMFAPRWTLGAALSLGNERVVGGSMRTLVDMWVRYTDDEWTFATEASAGMDHVSRGYGTETAFRLATQWLAASVVGAWHPGTFGSFALRVDGFVERSREGLAVFFARATPSAYTLSITAAPRLNVLSHLALYAEIRLDIASVPIFLTDRGDLRIRGTMLLGTTVWW